MNRVQECMEKELQERGIPFASGQLRWPSQSDGREARIMKLFVLFVSFVEAK